MLKTTLKLSVGALLLTVVASSAAILHAGVTTGFRPCSFPSCAVLPGGNARVLCKVGRTGPIYVKYLNQCCCGGDNWLNMFSYIEPPPAPPCS